VLALTYFPPKEQESSNTVAANKAAQQVAALQEGALQETALQAAALQEAALQEAATQGAATQEVACFPCHKCENVCTDMDSLRSHMTEHTNTVCLVTREARSLTASGRLLILTPNFGNKHQKFVDTINNDHVDGIDTSDDDDESNDFEHACKVCKKIFSNVSSLQDHILDKHSTQSGGVLELLKLQSQLLNSLLAGQATQLQRVNAMALQQTCLMNVKDIQKSLFPRPPLPPPPPLLHLLSQ
jgi:hypothetical protein